MTSPARPSDSHPHDNTAVRPTSSTSTSTSNLSAISSVLSTSSIALLSPNTVPLHEPTETQVHLNTLIEDRSALIPRPASTTRALLTHMTQNTDIDDDIDRDASESILNLPTMNQTQRFELANNVAIKAPSILLKNLDQFKLNSEQQMAIAYTISQKSPFQLGSNLQKFTLDKKHSFKFAQLLAEKVPYVYSNKSKKIGVARMTYDQRLLIAQILLKKNPSYVIFSLSTFDLPSLNEHQRYTFALVITKTKGIIHIPKVIHEFFLSYDQRRTIAFLLVKKNILRELVQRIKRFNLKTEHQFYIAIQAAQKIPQVLAQKIKTFNLNHEQRLKTALLISTTAPSILAYQISNFALDKSQFKLLAQKSLATYFSHESGQPIEDIYHNKTMPQEILERYLVIASIIPQVNMTLIQNNPRTIKLIIKEIAHWRNEEQFDYFLEALIAIDKPQDFINFNSTMTPNGLLTSLFIWKIVEKNWENCKPSERHQIIQHFAHRQLKESSRMDPVLNFLILTRQQKNMTQQEKNNFLLLLTTRPTHQLHTAVSKQQLKVLITNLKYASIFMMLREANVQTSRFCIQDIKQTSELISHVKQAAIHFLQLPKGEGDTTSKAINQYLSSTRQPEALLTYATVHLQSEDAIKKAISNYAQQVIIHKNFASQRYSVHQNTHLKFIQKINSALFFRWTQQSTCTPPHTLQTSEIEKITSEVVRYSTAHDYLKKCIAHTTHWNTTEYTLLTQVLDKKLSPQDALKTISNISTDRIIHNGIKNDDIIFFEKSLIELIALENPSKQYQQLILICRNSLTIPSQKIKTDLDNLLRALNPNQKKQNSDWYVNISDTAEDLLLCGTEVLGSCQRVDGIPELNSGLLGYLLDGKIKLLTVKNTKNNSIIARQIIRLLLDAENTPVLHIDKIYHQTGLKNQQKKAMHILINNYSQWLGVTIANDNNTVPYPLQSLGGSAPFEYVDAAGGIYKNGIYQIMK